MSWFPAIIKNGGPWPLVLLGQLGLAASCAAFMAAYAYASGRVWRWAGGTPGWRRVCAVLVIDPLLWAGAECVPVLAQKRRWCQYDQLRYPVPNGAGVHTAGRAIP